MKNTGRSFFSKIIFIVCFTFTGLSGRTQQTVQEANYIHDKMYGLINQSQAVQLPSDIVKEVENFNKENPARAKIVFAQLSMLKVMYNASLSKADIRFFGKQILSNQSATFTPIHTLVKQRLNKL